MKKRIIALILVVVMSALALFGCGEYDYSKAKLDKFTSVKVNLKDEFLKLQIEDEKEFSADEEQRKKELHDIILRSILNSDYADATEYKTGIPDYADALYFSYYAEYTDDAGVKHIFNIEKTEGKTNYYILPANYAFVQFGVIDNADNKFYNAIQDAFMDKEDIEDNIYTLDQNFGTGSDRTKPGTGDKTVSAGDKVLLTFTYKSEDGKSKTIKYYMADIPSVKPEEAKYEDAGTGLSQISDLRHFDTFLYSLIGKKVGETLVAADNKFEYNTYTVAAPTDEDPDATETKKVSYVDVKIDGIVNVGKVDEDGKPTEKGSDIVVNIVLDSDAKKMKDIFGNEVAVAGEELTYHILPLYTKKVDYVKITDESTEEDYKINVSALLTDFYGSAAAQEVVDENGNKLGKLEAALKIFASEEYKNEDGKTFADLMIEYKELQEKYEKAKENFESAKTAYDKAEIALEDAQSDYDSKLEAYKNADITYRYVKALADIAEAEKNSDNEAKALAEADKTKALEDAAAFDAEKGTESDKGLAKKLTEYDVDDLDSAKKMLDDAKVALYGNEANANDKGAEGKLEDAKKTFSEKCKALYGHKDADKDCKCDNCGIEAHINVEKGSDEKLDCKCDTCGADVFHTDKDPADCVCDVCEAALPHKEGDKKNCKCDTCDAQLEHVDKDENEICDVCEQDGIAKGLNKDKAEEVEKDSDVIDYDASAEGKLEAAKTARDEFVDEKLFDVAPVNGVSVVKAVYDEFYDGIYDMFEEDYFNKIDAKLREKAYKLIMDSIDVNRDKLPRKAVNEVYKKLYEQEKLDFYTSADSQTNNYYNQFGGSFKKYLMSQTGTSSFKDAKNKLKENAKDYVVEVMKIYKAAQVLGLTLTEAEYDAFYNSKYDENQAWIYEYLGMEHLYMNEQDLQIAAQLNKLLDNVFKVKTDADGKPVYENGKYQYTMLKYSF